MLPPDPLTPETYLRDRLQDQRRWYRDRAKRHDLTRLAVVTGVGVGNGVAAALAALQLDAWVAVVTTAIGAVAAFGAVTAADFLASSYRSTARQLDDLERSWQAGLYGKDERAFQRFVMQVEQVIGREHSGWVGVIRHVSEQAK
jgi:SMODS and SLOG-associating 2TM effector domain 1